MNNSNHFFQAIYAGFFFLVATSIMISACEREPFEPKLINDPNPTDTTTTPIDTTINDTSTTPTDTSNVKVCSPDTVYFNPDITMILDGFCVSCHNQDLAEDGVRLDSYLKVMDEVKAGKPDNSSLFKVLIDSDPKDRMPYEQDPLSSSDIALIKRWIEQGAKNNVCDTAGNNSCANIPSFSNVIQPIISTYCATSSGCHASGASGRPVLETYSEISGKADRIKATAVVSGTMPKAGSPKPTSAELDSLKAWIDCGAPNN